VYVIVSILVIRLRLLFLNIDLFPDLLLLLPNNDLLQQFEDYVIELRCEKGRRKEKKYNKK